MLFDGAPADGLVNERSSQRLMNFSLDSSQDSSQIELLKELMDLQKDMIVMMLSLLEGSAAQTFILSDVFLNLVLVLCQMCQIPYLGCFRTCLI